LGILNWFYSKGLAGAIAKDLIKKYLKLRNMYPLEEESKLVDRVWNFWLTLNKEHIIQSKDEQYIIRLEIMEDKYENNKEFITNLYQLYKTIIYIEIEILSTDGKTYDNVIKVFLNEVKKANLDYQKEYESELRTRSNFGFKA